MPENNEDPVDHCYIPDTKVHGANMGPTWVLLAPDGPHGWPHEPCHQGVYVDSYMGY